MKFSVLRKNEQEFQLKKSQGCWTELKYFTVFFKSDLSEIEFLVHECGVSINFINLEDRLDKA